MSGLRDVHAQFSDADAQVLGVSMDTLETQTKFAESLNLPFPLLADPEGVAAKAYGVANVEKGFANRVTFVIEKDGKVSKVIEGKDAIDPTAALDACRTAPAGK
jgi:peroxiredoxin Q/BCP